MLEAPALTGPETRPDLCALSVGFLESCYRESDGLFPYSTRREGGRVTHDFEHPHTVRYTINSLLGLQAAHLAGRPEPWLAEVPALVDRFAECQLHAVENPGDLGLAALLFAEGGNDLAEPVLRRLALHTRPELLGDRTLQELCWMLWGAAANGREELADALARRIRDDRVDPHSGLARHTQAWPRRRAVSFGALVYYLRGLHEHASLTGATWSGDLFRSGVERLIALQGPQGEWPWQIDVRRGIPLDVYPVFAVHQDAMAMLFLLPALDQGLPGAAAAIRRSVAWVHGENELGEPLDLADPPFAYRSIRRDERLRPQRRALRSLAQSFAGRPGRLAGPARVTINRECRSYHPGWILYAWSPRADAAELLA